MDKKVVFGIATVLTFFAGAIWVSEVPVVATLVALLELAAGWAYGYFFKKYIDDTTIKSLTEEIEKLKEAKKVVKSSAKKPVAKKE